jgi:hypothetical protein
MLAVVFVDLLDKRMNCDHEHVDNEQLVVQVGN